MKTRMKEPMEDMRRNNSMLYPPQRQLTRNGRVQYPGAQNSPVDNTRPHASSIAFSRIKKEFECRCPINQQYRMQPAYHMRPFLQPALSDPNKLLYVFGRDRTSLPQPFPA